jgi:hypothetical protein
MAMSTSRHRASASASLISQPASILSTACWLRSMRGTARGRGSGSTSTCSTRFSTCTSRS